MHGQINNLVGVSVFPLRGGSWTVLPYFIVWGKVMVSEPLNGPVTPWLRRCADLTSTRSVPGRRSTITLRPPAAANPPTPGTTISGTSSANQRAASPRAANQRAASRRATNTRRLRNCDVTPPPRQSHLLARGGTRALGCLRAAALVPRVRRNGGLFESQNRVGRCA